LVVNGYAQFMPYFPGYFNHILTTFPAEFILEEATWQEFNRVLSPTGRVTWLPAAWITSKSPISRAAAWLFRVTHQAPSQDAEFDPDRFALLIRLGFDVTLEYRDLDRSKVLIIRAQKVPLKVEPYA
jgi:hypothetical protein